MIASTCSISQTAMCTDLKKEKVNYSIHKYSSFSGKYIPSNIMKESRADQSSRWSSNSIHGQQFITLKLEKVAVVHGIKFGKFEKVHVCDLKKFRVYGGMQEDHMSLLLDSGLRNDNVDEMFDLCRTENGLYFPCRYIKIKPLQTWGPCFNYSIWYVEILGSSEGAYVRDTLDKVVMYKKRLGIQTCLKFLRRERYHDVCDGLVKTSGVALEHPIISRLHTALVLSGDFVQAEEILKEAYNENYFNEYITSSKYAVKWDMLQPLDEDFCSPQHPNMRAGHQVVWDSVTRRLILFGGWDGYESFGDLWFYDTEEEVWTCASSNTESQGGPSPRACHRMCIDADMRQVYLLGKFFQRAEEETSDDYKNDFFLLDLENYSWTRISEDTAQEGGPNVLFDHQMCIDTEHRRIFVFGGKTIGRSTEGAQTEYSGLYLYDIANNGWECLMRDCDDLPSRYAHAMVFQQNPGYLYILGGQRNSAPLRDFYRVDVTSLQVTRMGPPLDLHLRSNDSEDTDYPRENASYKATIDNERSEIYVLAGISQDYLHRCYTIPVLHNSFWVYSIDKGVWCCVYDGASEDSENERLTPKPRFAAALAYDTETKTHFLHGGNPGKACIRNPGTASRLDDLWKLSLARPSIEDVYRRMRYRLRVCHHQEMVTRNPSAAIKYQHTQLTELYHPESEKDQDEFQSLPYLIFGVSTSEDDFSPVTDVDRRQVAFEELCSYFPRSFVPPHIDLMDILPL